MEILEKYQIRGVPGQASRTSIEGRRVDFWSPENPTHLIVCHDGQNILDRRTATRRKTWQLAKASIKVAEELGMTPPAIIGVYHGGTKKDPNGRYKDLTPEGPYRNGVKPILPPGYSQLDLSELRGDWYQKFIAETVVPTISAEIGIDLVREKTAMLGSSMGGLATLYGVGLYPNLYGAALSFSPHWVIGANPLVDALIDALPGPDRLRLWMSRGTKGLDGTYEPFQDYADERAQDRGFVMGQNLSSKVFERTSHSEKSWASYVDQALRFWLRS
jgi:predicted alpha/beta superfamily hydrolase